jgi:indolepyruvate ferredoxin oxidoreductase
VKYHLHPPTLRRLGMKKKPRPLGAPYQWAFQGLSRMKRLRGTPFDLFGLDPDRKLERALITEYEDVLRRALDQSGLTYDDRVLVAASPMSIKGYFGIKEAAAQAWRDQVVRLVHPPASRP